MSSSPRRLAANQKNAARSTGPTTPEGKAASRANALKHGLTGNGTVASRGDLDRVAEVARELRDQYHPATAYGRSMLDLAALQIVRLDRLGRHEDALVDGQVAAAVYDFDAARRDFADELFDGLEADPSAVDRLLLFPEGVDRLVEGWWSLSALEDWSPADLDRLALLSGSPIDDPAALRDLIPDRVRRLESLKVAIDRRPIELARARAADLALFGTSPEAILARRYEAAIERSLRQSMKAFHEAEGSIQPTPEAPGSPGPSEPDDQALGRAMKAYQKAEAPAKAPNAPLGSLLLAGAARVDALPSPVILSSAAPESAAPNPRDDRASRPDPRKLLASQRRKGR